MALSLALGADATALRLLQAVQERTLQGNDQQRIVHEVRWLPVDETHLGIECLYDDHHRPYT